MEVLAQLKAEAEVNAEAQGSILSAIGSAMKTMFDRIFNPPNVEIPDPPPKYENGGCELNMVSVNKNYEGSGAGASGMG